MCVKGFPYEGDLSLCLNDAVAGGPHIGRAGVPYKAFVMVDVWLRDRILPTAPNAVGVDRHMLIYPPALSIVLALLARTDVPPYSPREISTVSWLQEGGFVAQVIFFICDLGEGGVSSSACGSAGTIMGETRGAFTRRSAWIDGSPQPRAVVGFSI